jgi:DNA-binding MarR family transcriptional regulator/GNAT superfamily N-acetyltransferase
MKKHLSDYGLLTLASLMKKVSDRLFRDIDNLFQTTGSGLSARLVPCLMLIKDSGQLSITELADKLGQTHSAVSQMSRRLLKEGVIFDAPDPQDERRRMLSLTPKGYEQLDRLDKNLAQIRDQLRSILTGDDENLIQILSRLDTALHQQPLNYRVLSATQDPKLDALEIVDFKPEFASAFKQLNIEWLEKYFYVEAIDEQILSQPESAIIAPGGQIFIALLEGRPVGTAALIAVDDDSFELSKMAVSHRLQGRGIGRQLVNRAIRYFKESGRKRLFLESNSKLKPALKLYESVGFIHKHKPDGASHYQRADVYMEYAG